MTQPQKSTQLAPQGTPTHLYRKAIADAAMEALRGTVPPADLGAASARVLQAFQSARAAARDPKDYDAVLTTQEGRDSITRCIQQAALSGILPGGASPLAWIIPQRPASDRPMELRYSLSHRGASAIASDEGWAILPVAVHVDDVLTVDFGEVIQHESCGKDPYGPWVDDKTKERGNDLLGVYLTIRREGKLIARPWMSASQVESHRRRSPMAKRNGDLSGPWATDYVAMAQKTIIHYAVARGMLPLKSSVARDAITAGEIDTVQAPAELAAPKRIAQDPPEAAEEAREKVAAPADRKPAPDPDDLP